MSAYPGHDPRPLLLRQSSSWLHWLEPTCIMGVPPTHSTRANQEFPRSEESFVAALGLCYTPSYFRVNMSVNRTAHPREGLKDSLTFRFSLLGRLINPREPVLLHDASNTHFLRRHNSQLAEVTISDLWFIHIPARFPD